MKAPALDLSALPQRYRENWTIYSVLRADAVLRYATARANAMVDRGDAGWFSVFDAATERWHQANPLSSVWLGAWPEGAAVHPSAEAIAEARAIMAAQDDT